MATEVDGSRNGGQEEAERRERRDHQEQDGIAEEAVEVGGDEEKAREDKRGDDGEEAGVP
jgi:hypothetical protein